MYYNHKKYCKYYKYSLRAKGQNKLRIKHKKKVLQPVISGSKRQEQRSD